MTCTMYSCNSQSAQTYALLAILLVAPRIVDSIVPVRVTFCCPSVVAPCIVDSIVPAWVTVSLYWCQALLLAFSSWL